MKFKKMLFGLGVSSMLILSSTASLASNFRDVDTHWSRFYVERLEEKGIVNGYNEYGEMYFNTEGSITREEVSTMLSRYIGGEGGKKTLKDIENRWSTPYIKYLLDKNIIGGYPDNTFRPSNEITRAEFAIMINKYLEQNGKISDTNKTKVYDINGHWAEKAITNVIKSGYMDGYEDGSFRPENSITRAESSAVLALIDGAFKTKDLSYDSGKLEEMDNFLTKAFGDTILSPYKGIEMPRGKITDTDILEMLGKKTWSINREGFKQNIESGLYSITLNKEEIDNYTMNIFGKTIDHDNTSIKINKRYGNPVARNNGDGTTELFIEFDTRKDIFQVDNIKQVDTDMYVVDIFLPNSYELYQILIEKKDGKDIITEIIEDFDYFW